jgi:ectoine hydroxylase
MHCTAVGYPQASAVLETGMPYSLPHCCPCLTPEEGQFFEENGYLHVPAVLAAPQLARLLDAADMVDAWARQRESGVRLNLLDFVGLHDEFLELIDCPTTFPKVWGIMGWHISLYHSHMITTMPTDSPPEEQLIPLGERGGWHQDSGRLNHDLEGSPTRPRISIKVGYFLTDSTSDGTGFQVIPGSHNFNLLQPSGASALASPQLLPSGAPGAADAISVRVRAGDAVLFDRRVWHNGGAQPHHPDAARKVLFYG